jgi:uncharacterized protein (DUF3820 family)
MTESALELSADNPSFPRRRESNGRDQPSYGPWFIITPMNSEKLALLLTREMPYGKYKGRKLADLPGHYLGWFAREGFPSGELGALIALMYELDHNDLRSLLDPLRAR